MDITEYLQRSLKKAIAKAGNMRRYAETVGVNYATINRFNSGIQDIGNMPVQTMLRLFPELKLYCFTEDIPLDQLSPPTVGDNEIIEEMPESEAAFQNAKNANVANRPSRSRDVQSAENVNVLKFALTLSATSRSENPAAVISPIAAGRKLENKLCTRYEDAYFLIAFATRMMMITDGVINPSVATIEPGTPATL